MPEVAYAEQDDLFHVPPLRRTVQSGVEARYNSVTGKLTGYVTAWAAAESRLATRPSGELISDYAV